MPVFINYFSLINVVKVPIPSIVTFTSSPGCKNCGGFIQAPTPAGVPVAIMSPGCNATYLEISAFNSTIFIIFSFVFSSYLFSLFVFVSISVFCLIWNISRFFCDSFVDFYYHFFCIAILSNFIIYFRNNVYVFWHWYLIFSYDIWTHWATAC